MSFNEKEYQREAKKKLRKRRQANGLCQICGKPKEDIQKSACISCLERVRVYHKTDIGKEKHKASRQKRAQTSYGIWRRAKDSAKTRGIEFNLSEEDIIIPDCCPLLGIPLTFNNSNSNKHSSASLDRIDNSKGYIKGNVWVISHLANMMKRDVSIEQLRAFAKNILLHFPD